MWIACKDKMPTNDNCLLAWHYPLGQKDIVGGGATIATYSYSGRWWRWYPREIMKGEVTHWQPLPLPPPSQEK